MTTKRVSAKSTNAVRRKHLMRYGISKRKSKRTKSAITRRTYWSWATRRGGGT